MKIENFPLLMALILALVFLPIQQAHGESKSASEQAGANLFRDKGCAYCHGSALQGTQKGPSLATVRKSMKAPQIASQIENGGQKMPAFGDSLSPGEISQLVSFLRAKHHPAAISLAPAGQ